MKSKVSMALEAARDQFEKYDLFPRWYGRQLWRFFTKYFRVTPKKYAEQYYTLGFIDGREHGLREKD